MNIPYPSSQDRPDKNRSSAEREYGDQESPLEVLAPSAAMVLERASVDTQVAHAQLNPRKIAKFYRTAMDMITIDAETADSCIYVRPVGKDRSGKMQYAEGPSVRAAEIVAVCYGNLRVKSQIIEQTDRYVKTQGQAFDVENNVAFSVERTDPTVKSSGEPMSESMRNVIALASISKATRDAIFRVVPRALCKKLMETAKEAAKGHGTLAERIKRAQAWIKTLNIDDRRVFAVLGIASWDACLPEHLNLITGLRTAMRDDDIPVDEAFPPLGVSVEKPTAPREQPKAAPIKRARVAAPQKDAEANPEPNLPPKEQEPTSENVEKQDTPAELPQPESEPPQATETPDVPASTEEPEAIPTEAHDLVKFIYGKLGASGLKASQLIAFLKQTKTMRADQKQLGDLSTVKLMQIAERIETVKDAVAKFAE